MQETQLNKLSVRLKVQRFESSGYSALSMLSPPSSSPRSSGIHSPTQMRIAAKTVAPVPPPKPAAPHSFKENSAPIRTAAPQPPPPAAPSAAAPLPAAVVIAPQPAAAPLQPHHPLLPPPVQMRQPSGKSLLTEQELSFNRRSLADFTNYNTAPRGWTQSGKEIYRPVTFNLALS